MNWLEIALRTWPKRDRRESGDVVLSTALDLVDAGSSVRSEALGLARTGVRLRARGLGRDFLAAPWAAGARLFAIGCGLCVMAFMVSHSDGPWNGHYRGPTTDDGTRLWAQMPTNPLGLTNAATAELLAMLAAIAVAAFTLLRRHLVAAMSAIGAMAVIGIARGRGYGFGETSITYPLSAHHSPTGSGVHEINAGLDLNGLVGWMFVCAAIASVALAIVSRREVRVRPSRRAVAWLVGSFAVAGLVVPPLAAWLDSVVLHGLSWPDPFGAAGRDSEGFAVDPAPVWAFALIGVVAVAAAVSLRRRRADAALGAVLVIGAFWIPGAWLATGVSYAPGTFARVLRWFIPASDGWIPAWWVLLGATWLAIGGLLAVSLGRRMPARPARQTREA